MHLNILAPIDLARNAEAQVGYAIAVARSLSSDLTLLYVADALHSSPAGGRIEWPASAVGERLDSRIRRVALRGPAVETVAEYADEAGADMVILTSRHHGRWGRLWTASVAADIVTSTRRPILVTKAKKAGPIPHMPFRRVLSVSLDGTDESAVRYADSITATLQGELKLVHLIPEVPEALYVGPRRSSGAEWQNELLPAACRNCRTASVLRTAHPYWAVRLVRRSDEVLGNLAPTSS